MRNIGLHLRLTDTLADIACRAVSLEIPIFQCFFIRQDTNQFISLSDEEIDNFLKNWRSNFQDLYLHGSYWINLAQASSKNKIIKREINLAKRVQFTHIIIHTGAATKSHNKQEALATVARNLNNLLKTEHEIKIVLENSAHAGLSIGGNLQDFFELKQMLDHPEKILFCIDTAHAFVYGYDIFNPQERKNFLKEIERTIGFDSVAVIHLNDTQQLCRSRIDKHEKIGSGLLGPILQDFVNYELLKKVPLIMELPVMSQQDELQVLEIVRKW